MLRHRRRGDTGSRSNEKLIPAGVAEPRQGVARGRLAQGKALGGARNRARLVDRFENGHQIQVRLPQIDQDAPRARSPQKIGARSVSNEIRIYPGRLLFGKVCKPQAGPFSPRPEPGEGRSSGHERRELAYCGRSGLRPWTPQLGEEADLQGSPGKARSPP